MEGKMEGKKVCKTLPDHLVERIIAMIPFPTIFQARCLSKSWRARFDSIASQNDTTMKRIASSFQMLLSERSKNWETFCPVFVGSNRDLVAYDKKAHKWRKLPSLSFLPEDVDTGHFEIQIEGALLYASDFEGSDQIYVANVLTRTWKRLPFPPTSGCAVYSSKLVVTDMSLGTYKVFLFCQRDLYDHDLIFVEIYDSKPGSWSSMTLDLTLSSDAIREFSPASSAFLDGVIYITTAETYMTLLAYNVEQGTVKQLSLSATTRIPWTRRQQLVVCKDKLLMVLTDDTVDIFPALLSIDLDSLIVTVLDSGPPITASLKSSWRALEPVGDIEHIFLGYLVDDGSRMRAYNINADLWSASFAPPTFSDKCEYNTITSFRPGFGPFAAV